MDGDTMFALFAFSVAGIMVSIMVVVGADLVYTLNNTDVVTETGQIVSVTPHLGSQGGIEYLTVLFGNGRSYDVVSGAGVDFTMHSSVIVELARPHHLLPWMNDGFWRINVFYKVPGGD